MAQWHIWTKDASGQIFCRKCALRADNAKAGDTRDCSSSDVIVDMKQLEEASKLWDEVERQWR